MGLVTFVGRIVLVVMNIIFILLSLTLIVGGFIIRFAHDWLRPHAKPILDKIGSVAKDVYGELDFDKTKFELGSYVTTLAYLMIVLGVILVAISLIGCCGACCSLTTVILVYAIILIVLLLAQIVCVIIAFGRPDLMKGYIRASMEGVMDEYDGIKANTVSGLGWNWAMQEFECCGADNYKDFEKKGSKYKNPNANDNAPIGGTAGDVVTPVACCKTLPANSAARATCAGNAGKLPNQSNSNKDKGCAEEIWTSITVTNQTYFLVAIIFCFIVEIVLIIFAILVYKNRGVTGGLV